MQDLIDALGQYVRLTDAQAKQIGLSARRARFAKGAHVFLPPEIGKRLFFLLSGLVRCYYVFQDKEVNLRLLCEPSAVLPLSSCITRTPTQEYIQCLSDCRGYVLPVDAMFEEGSDWEHVRRVLAERHYLAMERRLLMIQYKSARQRYRYFQATMEPKIVAEVPALHVASYLGITPESLSRIKRS